MWWILFQGLSIYIILILLESWVAVRKYLIKWSRLIGRFPTVLLISIFISFYTLSTYLLPTIGAFHFKRRSLIIHTLYSIDPYTWLNTSSQNYCTQAKHIKYCQRHCRQLMEHLVILELIRYIDEKRRYCADTSGMTGSAACRCLRTCRCRSSWWSATGSGR